jgi:hypothetical protein
MRQPASHELAHGVAAAAASRCVSGIAVAEVKHISSLTREQLQRASMCCTEAVALFERLAAIHRSDMHLTFGRSVAGHPDRDRTSGTCAEPPFRATRSSERVLDHVTIASLRHHFMRIQGLLCHTQQPRTAAVMACHVVHHLPPLYAQPCLQRFEQTSAGLAPGRQPSGFAAAPNYHTVCCCYKRHCLPMKSELLLLLPAALYSVTQIPTRTLSWPQPCHHGIDSRLYDEGVGEYDEGPAASSELSSGTAWLIS